MYQPHLASWDIKYRKLSIKGASPYKGAPCFPDTQSMGSWTFLAISQPKMVRFSFCKKPLEGGNVLYPIGAPPKVLPQRPAPLLENLRYITCQIHGFEQ